MVKTMLQHKDLWGRIKVGYSKYEKTPVAMGNKLII